MERENETPWHASNGFLKRNTPNFFVAPEILPAPANSARQQYRHLISDRGFEDILQACRPRNRGEYGSGLPVPLAILLKKTVPKGNVDRYPLKTSLDRDSQQHVPLGEVGCLTPHRTMHTSRSRYLEWGAVNFDDYTHKRLNNSQQTQSNRSLSGSQSSPSSSFTSIGSYMLPSQLLGISHLQSTTSLEGGGHSVSSSGGDTHMTTHKKHHSDGSMATLDDDEIPSLEKVQTFSAIQKLMADHDKSIFSSSPKTNHAKNNAISQSLIEDNEAIPGSPMLEGRGLLRSQSAMFPVLNKGGIEAALVQYDVTIPRKEQDSVPRAGLLENYMVNPEEAVGRSSLGVSPLSTGMPFSLDRRNERLRPSFMRLVAPDTIPPRASRLSNAADGFQPLDSQRKNSFYLSQTKTKSRNDVHSQNKSLGQTAKDSRLGDRHNSQREKSKEIGSKNNDHSATLAPRQPHQQTAENGATSDPRRHTQTLSPQRVKSKKQHGRKPHHHHSYRHRRKPWVLNPFRQEDEDEVLAKRTHNRRRWSHVFPLGEDEFKRHAGPNWKSLCQPAIRE